jgi:hypothetical protein
MRQQYRMAELRIEKFWKVARVAPVWKMKTQFNTGPLPITRKDAK